LGALEFGVFFGFFWRAVWLSWFGQVAFFGGRFFGGLAHKTKPVAAAAAITF
jgi:hypothetical protein